MSQVYCFLIIFLKTTSKFALHLMFCIMACTTHCSSNELVKLEMIWCEMTFKQHQKLQSRRYMDCMITMHLKDLNSVLVLAGIELIFFLLAGIMLCFGFRMRIMLITH